MSEAVIRARVEDAIETLVSYLDKLDGDTDMEPSLGATASMEQHLAWWSAGNHQDLEAEHDGREPDDYE